MREVSALRLQFHLLGKSVNGLHGNGVIAFIRVRLNAHLIIYFFVVIIIYYYSLTEPMHVWFLTLRLHAGDLLVPCS